MAFWSDAGYENIGATWFQEGKRITKHKRFNAGPVVAYDFIDYFFTIRIILCNEWF